jgi:hypothetical protein
MRKFLTWFGIIIGALLLLAVIAAPILLSLVTRRGMFMIDGFGGMRAAHGFGFFWIFGGIFMLLSRLLLPLLVVGLLFWIAYTIGRNSGQRYAAQGSAAAQGIAPAAAVVQSAPPAPAPAQPVEVIDAPVVVEAGPSPAAEPACPNCGRTVQAGWVACPYCGEKL